MVCQLEAIMLVQALLNMDALLMLTDTLETWDLGPVHFFFPFLLFGSCRSGVFFDCMSFWPAVFSISC
jgi:hypothetical protein